ncbi:hypothetical protein AAG906_005438 [Vitis piasezkii]
MRCGRRSHLSDTLRARLGPQAPSVEGQSHMLETLRAHLGSLTTTPMLEKPSQLPRQEVLPTRAPPDSISRRLDDMLSMTFSPHIINYEPPRDSYINSGTSFFESLAKKPLTTMDDLFKWADKYFMLKDDVRAASQ